MNEKIICKIISDCHFIRSSRTVLKYSSASGNSKVVTVNIADLTKEQREAIQPGQPTLAKRRTYFIGLCVRQKRMSISTSIT